MNGKDDKGMFCHKCGAKVIEGAAFCQKCVNSHLQYLSPYFDGWDYFKDDVVIARANLAGAVRLAVTALQNTEIRLCELLY